MEIEKFTEEKDMNQDQRRHILRKEVAQGHDNRQGRQKAQGNRKERPVRRSRLLLGVKVYLEMWVKVKENWRDSDIALSTSATRIHVI